jgi:hypothetical protein
VEQALDRFVLDVRDLYGEDLVAVFLYGSATTGEHIAGRSDINVGIVLGQLTPAALRKASGHLRVWGRHGFATPVFFDPPFLRDALDVFPIEFLDMQTHHRALWGPDLLADLRVGAEPLRRQCEAELRGKLLKLRQAYVESSRSPKDLEAVLVSAVNGLIVLAMTVLRLAGREDRGRTAEILDRVEAQLNVSVTRLRTVWRLKRGEIRVTGVELDGVYQGVLEEFQRLVQVVDALPA